MTANNVASSIKCAASLLLPRSAAYFARDCFRESRCALSSLRDRHSVTKARSVFLQRPARIGIETTTHCSAKCVFCAYQFQSRTKRFMSMALYKKCIQDYAAVGGGSIELTPVAGDPLCDPELIERIHFAARFPSISEIFLHTNAILLHKTGIRKLLCSGLTRICISTTAPDRRMFERLFRSNAYDTVMNNITSLLEINDRSNLPLKIEINMRADMPQSRIVRMPAFRQLQSHNCSFNFLHFYDDWSGRIKQNEISHAMRLKPRRPKNGPCSRLFTYPKVLVDGTVTACGCKDYEGNSGLVLGNAAHDTLFEIWHNGKLAGIIDSFAMKNYPAICRNCRDYVSFRHFACSREGKAALRQTEYMLAHAPAAALAAADVHAWALSKTKARESAAPGSIRLLQETCKGGLLNKANTAHAGETAGAK
jgi:MoaA/NifB/PqqE/SkfB family radical SAM enzyme